MKLVGKPLILLALEYMCGKIPDSLSRPRCQCKGLVFLIQFFYGCESWKTYGAQECRLNIFNMRLSRNMFRISSTNRRQNTFVCCLENYYQLCLRCCVNADCAGWDDMEDDRIPKDILYGALIAGIRDLGQSYSLGRQKKSAVLGRQKSEFRCFLCLFNFYPVFSS